MTAVRGKAGIVQLLSWSDTQFQLRLVFPVYAADAHHSMCRMIFKRQQQGGPDPLVSVSKQLLEGISHMHAQSIVHRDLKPSNFLVAAVGANTETAVRVGDAVTIVIRRRKKAERTAEEETAEEKGEGEEDTANEIFRIAGTNVAGRQ